MVHNDEEKPYKQAIDVLKQLPKVNAPLNFEADLMRRINSGKYEEKRKESLWDIFLSPARLVPTAALAIAAVIMFFMVDTTSVKQKDPLSPDARIREDIRDNRTADNSPKSEINEDIPLAASSSGFTNASNITKAGLNFRQIQLTNEEKEVLNRLKARIQQYINQNKESGK